MKRTVIVLSLILLAMTLAYAFQRCQSNKYSDLIEQTNRELYKTDIISDADIEIIANDSLTPSLVGIPGALSEWEYFTYLFVKAKVYHDTIALSELSTYIWQLSEFDTNRWMIPAVLDIVCTDTNDTF